MSVHDDTWFDFGASFKVGGRLGEYQVGTFFQDGRWQIESVRPVARCVPGCDSPDCECRANLEGQLTATERAEVESLAGICADAFEANRKARAEITKQPLRAIDVEIMKTMCAQASVALYPTTLALIFDRGRRLYVQFRTDVCSGPVEPDLSYRAAEIRARRQPPSAGASA